MTSRMIILFCMLLSLFLLFSVASAMLTSLRRRFRCRVPSVVWGFLFLLPLLPLSVPREYSPAQLYLTVDAAGNRVISVLAAEEKSPPPQPHLQVGENGEILYTGTLPERKSTDPLPEGLYVPAVLWEFALYSSGFLLFLWSMLSLAYLTHRVCGYIESIRYLTSRSVVCHDERICAVFSSAAGKVKLHRKAVLRVVEEGIHLSPCTSGFFTPTVYISHIQSHMAEDELEYIFLHELCHVKRHDFFLKALALLSTSVHFMAPFAGEVRRQVYEDCEFGCDRMVLNSIGRNRCGRYMQTILAIAEQKLQGSVIHGELFSYASSGKELFLRRYRNLQEETVRMRTGCRISLCAALLGICLLHMGLFSAVDSRTADNLLIDLQNPYLETVLREYFALPADEPLTMEHLDKIYCLEFSLSRKTDKMPGTLALCCTVNEGKYLLEPGIVGEEWAVLLQQDGLADGITPEARQKAESRFPTPYAAEDPLWEDMKYDCAIDLLPDVCPLPVLERYLPEDAEDRVWFLSCYRCLDGTPPALETYAADAYIAVIRESGLDVHASEHEIREAITQYCGKNGIAYIPDNPDTLGQLKNHRRHEILALSPAALTHPMAFLNPELSSADRDSLLKILYANELVTPKLLTGMEPDPTGRYTLDLADLVLFENLRTVILNDRLVMEDKTALTDTWCAVIER